MNDSRIVQVSVPDRMFFDPVNVFAGQFIGSPSMNLIDLEPVAGGLRLGGSDVTLTAERDRLPQWALSARRPLKLGVRPINVHLTDDPAAGVVLPVDDVFSVGRERFFSFRIGDTIHQGVDKRSSRNGSEGRIHFEPEGLLFFDAATGRRVGAEDAA
jgi:ABC-type sugar transport system ATPase subunit